MCLHEMSHCRDLTFTQVLENVKEVSVRKTSHKATSLSTNTEDVDRNTQGQEQEACKQRQVHIKDVSAVSCLLVFRSLLNIE